MKKFIYPLIAVTLSSIAISSITIAQQRKLRSRNYVEFLTSPDTSSLNVPFLEAVRVGNTLYLSGNIGNIPGQNKLVEGGIKAETKQAMENIKRVLKMSSE